MSRVKKKFLNKINFKLEIILAILLIFYIIGSLFFPVQMEKIYNYLGLYDNEMLYSYDIGDIPDYTDDKVIILNNNLPYFTLDELSNVSSYESYSDLDSLGRCGVAIANISIDMMPTQERTSIGSIRPSGWHTIKYDIVDGKYLYNRCHLIGFQLTGENANEKNLITCTRQMNTESMVEYENMVADYIKKTNNHVLYRVTPIFYDKNLVATGVEIEAYSIEDNGSGIQFNVFIYNVQDGININYLDGTSTLIK